MTAVAAGFLAEQKRSTERTDTVARVEAQWKEKRRLPAAANWRLGAATGLAGWLAGRLQQSGSCGCEPVCGPTNFANRLRPLCRRPTDRQTLLARLVIARYGY